MAVRQATPEDYAKRGRIQFLGGSMKKSNDSQKPADDEEEPDFLSHHQKYFLERFPIQLEEFTKKANTHEHPGEGIYFSIQDLKDTNLNHIPREDFMLFHCALASVLLIDQVMYTHFKKIYPEFRLLTKYPKIEYGITNVNINPWVVTHSGIGLTTLDVFLNFFVEHNRIFFKRHKKDLVSWNAVRIAMLNDSDVIDGPRGEILKKHIDSPYIRFLIKLKSFFR